MRSITPNRVRTLADRVAKSPVLNSFESRTLEAEIFWTTSDHSSDSPGMEDVVLSSGAASALDYWWGPSWRSDTSYQQVRQYLTSIDAILEIKSRLLPGSGGYELIEMDAHSGQAEVASHLISARTPALALLAAVLEAYADVLDDEA